MSSKRAALRRFLHSPRHALELSFHTTYRYEPLDANSSTIRVLSLHPSTDFTAIPEVTIHTIGLLDIENHKYEAISYAWGSSLNPKEIKIRNAPSKNLLKRPSSTSPKTYTLSVTSDLHEALRYLRLETEDRLLWCDAICINQGDDDEKSVQVGRMGEIYARAARAIAWLGPEEILPQESSDDDERKPGTKLALQLLEELGQKVSFDWNRMKAFPTTVENQKWADLDVPLTYDYKCWMSFMCLFQKSWFERLWIWQEIRLSNKSSLLMCGSSTILWSDFRNATGILYQKSFSGVDTFSFIKLRQTLDQILLLCNYNSKGGGLLNLLHESSMCKSTDPRDRIFALLSLLDEDDRRLGLAPDYSKKLEDVFQDVVLKFIQFRRTLDILGFCELEPRNETLPTWVPNWAAQTSSLGSLENASLQCASAMTDCNYRQVDPNILAVMGLRLGIIKEISCPSAPESVVDISDVGLLIQEYAPQNILDGDYAGGGSTLEAFSRTIMLNRFAQSYLPEYTSFCRLDSVQSMIRALVSAPKGTVHLDSAQRKAVSSDILPNFQTLNFCTTEEGYMGLVPCGAKAGDRIVMLLGFKWAMILRPKQQNYEVVGPCYIHGFMQSEALLGPMPENWEIVLRYDEKTTLSWRTFINHESGETRMEDPRLDDALPGGWERVAHNEDHCYNWFRNTKNVQTTTTDPRVSLEALRERGIDLEEFLLV